MRRALAAAAALIVTGSVAAWAIGPFGGPIQEILNQAVASALVTPSDTIPVANGPTRAIFNGSATACNIALKLQDDSAAVTFANVQSGEILPVRALYVMATNTTCAGIVALY